MNLRNLQTLRTRADYAPGLTIRTRADFTHSGRLYAPGQAKLMHINTYIQVVYLFILVVHIRYIIINLWLFKIHSIKIRTRADYMHSGWLYAPGLTIRTRADYTHPGIFYAPRLAFPICFCAKEFTTFYYTENSIKMINVCPGCLINICIWIPQLETIILHQTMHFKISKFVGHLGILPDIFQNKKN